MVNKKLVNVVFADFEADNIKIKNKNQSYLLQASAIKIDENGNQHVFDEHCFREKISKRISQLLRKERNFYNNKNFLSESNVMKQFTEFVQGCKIYSYGNFDKIILHKVRNRTRQGYNIKLINLENEFKNKLNLKNARSISFIAKIANINFSNYHNALEDARVLFEAYKFINSDALDLDECNKRKEIFSYYPKITSSEHISDISQEPLSLNEIQNFIFIYSEHKTIKNNVDETRKQAEEFLSPELSNYIQESNYMEEQKSQNEVTFVSIDNNNFCIYKTTIMCKEGQFIYDKICDDLMSNNNQIYITNWSRIINDYSLKNNKYYYFFNYKFLEKKFKPKIDILIDNKNFSFIQEMIRKIKEAIEYN